MPACDAERKMTMIRWAAKMLCIPLETLIAILALLGVCCVACQKPLFDMGRSRCNGRGRGWALLAPFPTWPSLSARSYLIDLCDQELHNADAPSMIQKQRSLFRFARRRTQDCAMAKCA